MEFVWFLLIGLVAGWLAGQLTKGGGFGLVGDLVVGVIGALLGGFLFWPVGSDGRRADRQSDRGYLRRDCVAVVAAADKKSLDRAERGPAKCLIRPLNPDPRPTGRSDRPRTTTFRRFGPSCLPCERNTVCSARSGPMTPILTTSKPTIFNRADCLRSSKTVPAASSAAGLCPLNPHGPNSVRCTSKSRHAGGDSGDGCSTMHSKRPGKAAFERSGSNQLVADRSHHALQAVRISKGGRRQSVVPLRRGLSAAAGIDRTHGW